MYIAITVRYLKPNGIENNYYKSKPIQNILFAEAEISDEICQTP